MNIGIYLKDSPMVWNHSANHLFVHYLVKSWVTQGHKVTILSPPNTQTFLDRVDMGSTKDFKQEIIEWGAEFFPHYEELDIDRVLYLGYYAQSNSRESEIIKDSVTYFESQKIPMIELGLTESKIGRGPFVTPSEYSNGSLRKFTTYPSESRFFPLVLDEREFEDPRKWFNIKSYLGLVVWERGDTPKDWVGLPECFYRLGNLLIQGQYYPRTQGMKTWSIDHVNTVGPVGGTLRDRGTFARMSKCAVISRRPSAEVSSWLTVYLMCGIIFYLPYDHLYAPLMPEEFLYKDSKDLHKKIKKLVNYGEDEYCGYIEQLRTNYLRSCSVQSSEIFEI